MHDWKCKLFKKLRTLMRSKTTAGVGGSDSTQSKMFHHTTANMHAGMFSHKFTCSNALPIATSIETLQDICCISVWGARVQACVASMLCSIVRHKHKKYTEMCTSCEWC